MTIPGPQPFGTGGVPNIEVIADYASVDPTYSVQIHTSLPLDSSAVGDNLKKLLRDPNRTAQPVLDIVLKQKAVRDADHLEKLVRAGMKPSIPAGTGGVPNIEVITDFADATAPATSFQIHTEVQLDASKADPATAVQEIEKILRDPVSGKKRAGPMHKILTTAGKVTAPGHLLALLEAALSHKGEKV